MSDLRLVRVTTLESPLQPYVAHYRLHRGAACAARWRRLAGRQCRRASRRRSARPIRWPPRLPPRPAGQHGARVQRGPRRPRRAGPAGLRRYPRRRPDGRAALRRDAVHHRLGRPAGHRALRDGVRLLRAGPAADAVAFPRRSCAACRRCCTIEAGEVGTARAPGAPRRSSPTPKASRQELIHFHDCVTTGRRR